MPETSTLRKNKLFINNSNVGRNTKTTASKIYIPDQEGFHIVKFEDIMVIKSQSNYSMIFINNAKKIMISKTLKTFEKVLPKQFFRIHNQAIVNKDYITKVNHSGSIELDNGEKVPMARSRKEQFIEWLLDDQIARIN